MGAVTLALVGFFAFVMLRVSQPAMGVLFSDLSPSDAAAIVKELDSRAVRTETRDDGATILAPRSEVARLRMDLAAKSLPSGGGVGYEIFDKGDAFSSTSFVQGVNQLRALEGELSRTIRSIGRVQSARVHLALPERRLFERDREAPRASIVLRTRGELSQDQVGAIRHLVASAVQGLQPEKISIVDERGRLLAGGQGQSLSAMGTAIDERRVALEQRLRSQLEEMLGGVVGPGRSRIQVAAELDLSRIESRQESFDPESRVLRSSQNRNEASASANQEGQVSVGNELPGARDQAPQQQPRESNSKTEEIVNYEISRSTRTELAEAGRLKRISVAVVVDGTYAKGQGGEATYQPRSKEDLERIAALVRSAVGFDKARGDQVEVVNLPLAEAPAALPAEQVSFVASLFSFTRDDLVRFLELGVIALLTLIVLLVVVRPMVKRVVAPDGPLAGVPGLAFAGGEPALAAAGAAPQIGSAQATPALAPAAAPAGDAAAPGSAEAGRGASPAEQIAKLGELARENPKEAAGVLRGWMNER
jgi:flagellar M-ring protein FliF